MAIEIVDIPIYPLNIVIFYSYVKLPEGIWGVKKLLVNVDITEKY